MQQAFQDCITPLLGEDPSPDFDAEEGITLLLEGVPFDLLLSEESAELLSIARIAPLPDEDAQRREALDELMRGNYAWGGTGGGVLGLDDESGLVCLCGRFFLPTGTPLEFRETLARQAALAAYWKKRLLPETRGETGAVPGMMV